MESLKDHTDFLDKCLAYNITVMAGTPLHVARGEGGVPAPFDWVRVRLSPRSLAVARQAVDLRIPGVNPMFHAL